LPNKGVHPTLREKRISRLIQKRKRVKAYKDTPLYILLGLVKEGLDVALPPNPNNFLRATTSIEINPVAPSGTVAIW